MTMVQQQREYMDGPNEMKMVVRYGVDTVFAKKHNQDPHFSLVCDIYIRQDLGRWMDNGGGAAGERIVKVFPELEYLVKWHLFNVNTGPLHYQANGMYWFDMAAGRIKPHQGDLPLDFFKKTIVYGALPSDQLHDFDKNPPGVWDRAEVSGWMDTRLEMLKRAFEVDMGRAEVTW